MGGLDGTPYAAEQIELVGDVENVVQQPDGLRPAPGELEDFVGDGVAAIDAADIEVGLWVEAVARGFERGAGGREISLGDGQVGVGDERLLNEPIELGVVV